MRGIVTEIRMSVISLKGRVLLKTLRALSLRTKGFVLRRRNLAAACGKHQHHIVSLSTLAPPKCKKNPSEYQIRNHLFELNITIIISSFFQSCVWYKSLWYSLFAITSIMIWPVLDLYQFTEYLLISSPTREDNNCNEDNLLCLFMESQTSVHIRD